MNEDVKLLLEGLKFCRSHEFCDGCPLEKKCLDKDSDFDIVGASADQIEALAAEIEAVLSKLEKATRERDAAIACIPRACGYCKHFIVTHNGCTPDYDCARSGCVNISGSNTGWEWRGVKEE